VRHRDNLYKTLIKVEVRSATSLKDPDFIGKVAPYAKVTFENDDGLPPHDVTHVIHDSQNPVWNTNLYFLLHDDCKSFKVEIWDKDLLGDNKLGFTHILRKEDDQRAALTGESYYLENGKGGTIDVYCQEIDLHNGLADLIASTDVSAFESFVSNKERENLLLLEVFVHGARDLHTHLIEKTNPYAQFDFSVDKDGDKVNPKHLRTKTVENNANPIWEEVFHFLVPFDLRSFKVEVEDEGHVSDESLGHSSVVVSKLGEHTKNTRLAVTKKGELEVSYFLAPLKVLFS